MVVLRGLSGLLGGSTESMSIHGEEQAQPAHRVALANLLAQPQGGSFIGMAGAPHTPYAGAVMAGITTAAAEHGSLIRCERSEGGSLH